jgi:hypothetical protein
MIRINRRVFILLFFLPIAGTLHSQDFGATVDTQSVATAGAGSFDMTLLNRTYVWFEAKSDAIDFEAQGSYRLTLDDLAFFDLDRLFVDASLPFQGAESTLIELKAGRFEEHEFTRYLLDHTLDGVSVTSENAMSNISAFLGFSGTLWDNLLTSIEMSKADNLDRNAAGLHFQPPRLIGMLGFDFNEIFPGFSLDAAFLFQQDFHDPKELVAEGTVVYDGSKGGYLDTQYAGIGIHGAPASFFFFDLFSYFGTGTTLSFLGNPDLGRGNYQYKPVFSALAGFSFRLYFEGALFSEIKVDGVYSTGDSDYYTYYEGNTGGNGTMFMPISHLPVGIAFDPDLGNIFFVSIEYSLLPFSASKVATLEKLETLVRGIAFFRSEAGVISITGLNPASPSLYLGTEAEALINWRPLSDVGFSAAAGLFFPDTSSDSSAFAADQAGAMLVVKMELSVSM